MLAAHREVACVEYHAPFQCLGQVYTCTLGGEVISLLSKWPNLMTTFTYCVGLSLCHDAGSAELDGAKQLRPLPSQEGEQAKHEAAKCLPC